MLLSYINYLKTLSMSTSEIDLWERRERHIAGMREFILFVRAQRLTRKEYTLAEKWPYIRFEIYSSRREKMKIECPICYLDIPPSMIVELNCHHLVCLTCCQKTATCAPALEPSCPMCREKTTVMKTACEETKQRLTSTILIV